MSNIVASIFEPIDFDVAFGGVKTRQIDGATFGNFQGMANGVYSNYA